MKPRTYVVLILTIVILGVLYYFENPSAAVETSYAIPTDWQLPVDTAKVVRIEMRAAVDTVIIDRKHGNWKYAQGGRGEADNSLVTRFLEGIANFRLLGLVSSNPRKQDFFRVGETGTMVDIMDEDGKHVSLVVGKMSALPLRSYVRPLASDMVYLARGMTPDIFSGGVSETAMKKVLRFDPAFIWSISIDSGQTAVTARQENGRWSSNEGAIPDSVMSPVLRRLEMIPGYQTTFDHSLDGRMPSLRVDVRDQKRSRLEFYTFESQENKYILKTSLSSEYLIVDSDTKRPFQDLLRVASVRRQVAVSVPPAPPRALPQRPPATISEGKKQKPTVPVQEPISSTPPSPPPSKPSLEKSERATTSRNIEEEGVLSVHTVKSGETLETIARQYNVTKDQLKRWNLLTKDDVNPGTELYVFVIR